MTPPATIFTESEFVGANLAKKKKDFNMSKTARTSSQGKQGKGSTKADFYGVKDTILKQTEVVASNPKQRFQDSQFSGTKTDTVVTFKDLKQHIEKFMSNRTDTNCDKVLESIYKFVKAKGKLGEEEKEDIGKLLKMSVHSIFNYLANFTYDFRPEYGIDLLIFRSTVQFLVDEFTSFPTGVKGETLETDLTELMNKYNTVNEMDQTIAHWKSYTTGMTDDEAYTSQDFKIPDGLPKSHIWWNL
ncbi:hypothetical protein Btru_061071 [Bulinus truncatus]|nr:hypothetical protein Btru_061071 [Bulinus truncatus]